MYLPPKVVKGPFMHDCFPSNHHNHVCAIKNTHGIGFIRVSKRRVWLPATVGGFQLTLGFRFIGLSHHTRTFFGARYDAFDNVCPQTRRK